MSLNGITLHRVKAKSYIVIFFTQYHVMSTPTQFDWCHIFCLFPDKETEAQKAEWYVPGSLRLQPAT